MTSTQLSRISGIFQELFQQQILPSSYLPILEERLVIACKPIAPRHRGKERRPVQDSRLHHKLKKAKKVYLDILDQDPHIFIPFILAITPRACETFNILQFLKVHPRNDRIHFLDVARATLDSIAQRHGIIQDSHYKALIQSLFHGPSQSLTSLRPEQPDRLGLQRSSPITTAESEDHWAYNAAHLEAIRINFGNYICDAIETARLRLNEQAKSPTLQTTECVRTRFPRQNFQDAIIWLDIGPTGHITSTLFPQATLDLLTGKRSINFANVSI
ncbi:hypothetical protein NPX13_g10360 [Xylaria arbuscula]|uniref:Uncharacterized protein n=1 Tax=Xylaria arbuscula TaxID=114810 RepID=A0A9W8N4Q3_9PEZI|nr:hypothetical protein NPX13_g10360 [Xylaria arbuscula]